MYNLEKDLIIKKIVVLLLLTAVTLPGKIYSEEIWKITALAWEPYSGEYIENQGKSIDRLRTILKKNGITLVVEFYPWERAKYKAREKGYAGYFPAWPEEVLDGFTASAPVDWSDIGVLKKKETDISCDNIESLFKNYSVGVVGTYVYPEVINNAMEKYPENTDTAPNELSLLRKLSTGRNQAALTDPSVMMYLAAKEGIDNIETLKIMMKNELVLAFRNEDDNRSKIKFFEKIMREEK